MKLLEIHKNAINAHNQVVSYYGLDYETKKVVFETNTPNEAVEIAVSFGYKKWTEIVMMF